KNPATDPYLPADPVVTDKCTGGNDTVANAGEAYQDLSIRTGGLRFPLCEFAGFDVVFQKIADDVITRSRVACHFDVPTPPVGQTLDYDKVAVNYTKGDGSGTIEYDQVLYNDGMPDCATHPDAFYINPTLNQVQLCPDTCNLVQADSGAALEVVFDC